MKSTSPLRFRFAVLAVCALLCGLFLAGCEPALPKSYGVYVKTKGGWQPVPVQGNIAAAPEFDAPATFLIFQPEMANPAARQPGVVSWEKGQLIRYNIEQTVAGQNSPPLSYSVARSDQIVFLPAPVSASTGPVDGKGEMLLVNVSAPLESGDYVFRLFGQPHPFRVNANGRTAAAAVAAAPQDKWYTTIDPRNGSTLDNFYYTSQKNFGEERQYNGHGIVRIDFSSPDRLESAICEAQKTFDDTVAGGKLEEMGRAVNRLRGLDREAGFKAQDRCVQRLKALMAPAAEARQWAVVRGWSQLGTQYGVGSNETTAMFSQALSAIFQFENAQQKMLDDVLAEDSDLGEVVASLPYIERITVKTYNDTATIRAAGVQLSGSNNLLSTSGGSTRVRDMMRIGSATRKEAFETKDSYYASYSDRAHSGGWLQFQDAAGRDAFVETLTRARQQWAEKRRAAFVTEIEVPSQFWSERVYLAEVPFNIVQANGAHDRVEVREDSMNPVLTTGRPEERLEACKWMQFRSLENHPVKLRIQRFPLVVEPEKKGF